MSKATPGPWRILNPHKSTNYIVVHNKEKDRVADTIPRIEDARLIAASPTMLDALKEAQIFLKVAASVVPNNPIESTNKYTGEKLKTRGLADVLKSVAESVDAAIARAEGRE